MKYIFCSCSSFHLESHGKICLVTCNENFGFDIQVACGKRAGAFTCLLDETGRYDAPEYANVEHQPDYKVSSLVEVQSLLERDFELTS